MLIYVSNGILMIMIIVKLIVTIITVSEINIFFTKKLKKWVNKD